MPRAPSCWRPTSSCAAIAAPHSAPSARPATMPSAIARWASASSTTSRSARRTRWPVHGIERVAIVDFDVHHGNGTEEIFAGDPRVLMVSTFQHPLYPVFGLSTIRPPNMVNMPLAGGRGQRGISRRRARPLAARARAAPAADDLHLGRIRRPSRGSARGTRVRRRGLRLGDARARRRSPRSTRRGGSSRRWKAATRFRRWAGAPRSTFANSSRRRDRQRPIGCDGAAAPDRGIPRGGEVERRKFLESCVAVSGSLGLPALPAWAECHPAALRSRAPRRHPRRAAQGPRRSSPRPITSSTIRSSSTPCFLLNLGRPAVAEATLRREDGTTYAWNGGVGPSRAIVAFSAICAHKLAYPTRDVSFIRYQPRRSATSDAQVIHCCADHSVYDPASGRARAGGAGAAAAGRHPARARRRHGRAVGARHGGRRAVRRVLQEVRIQAGARPRPGERAQARRGHPPSCANSPNTASRRSSASSSPQDSAIVVTDLSKTYGRVVAVNGSRSPCGAAPRPRSSAATAPARRRRCRCCSGS